MTKKEAWRHIYESSGRANPFDPEEMGRVRRSDLASHYAKTKSSNFWKRRSARLLQRLAEPKLDDSLVRADHGHVNQDERTGLPAVQTHLG